MFDDDYTDPMQEAMDYEAGCYGSELEAGYDLSRREREPDDKAQIDALAKAGRFVVYLSTEDFCRFTDASLGERRTYVADFATEEEALPELTSEDHCLASPPVVKAPAPAVDFADDDIPF